MDCLPKNTMLGNRYVIHECIGSGGFALIYKAYDTVLQCMAAVKEYYPHKIAGRDPVTNNVSVGGNHREEYQQGLDAFRKEAEVTAKIGGESGVIGVRDYLEQFGTAYIVMDLLEGQTLDSYIRENKGRIGYDEAESLMIQILRAVSHIHKNGYLHLDISADNIFVCQDHSIRLFDLGAACPVNGKKEVVTVKSACSPPEQYSEGTVQDKRTDMYAVGAVFYKLLTGDYPPMAQDRKKQGAMRSIRTLNQNVPVYLSNAIMRCLSLDRGMRIADADAMTEIITSRRTVRTPSELHFIVFASAAAALFVAIIGIAMGTSVLGRNSHICLTHFSPCTIYCEVPELFSESAGLAEAEAQFEKAHPGVDVILYTASADTGYMADIRPADGGTIVAYDLTLRYTDISRIQTYGSHAAESAAALADEKTTYSEYTGSVYWYRELRGRLSLLLNTEVVGNSRYEAVTLMVTPFCSPDIRPAAEHFLKFLTEYHTQQILFIEYNGIIPGNPKVRKEYGKVFYELAELLPALP